MNLIPSITFTLAPRIRRRFARSLAVGTLASLLVGQAAMADNPPPNIIIFYVDDLGWQDVQINDVDKPCPFETPNITKFAKAGMNFTQGYSPAPTCSPSRAGIITGQHPAKIGMTHVTLGRIEEGGKSERLVDPYLQDPLDLTLLTLADAMKANGYRTGHSGKWHVGLDASSYGFEVVNQERGPHRSMPDRTKGFATADDKKYPLSKEKYAPFSDKKPQGISYPYDEVTESALKFIGESGDKPFFLNLCHWMVHWPALTRNGELLEYYCDKMGQPFPPKPGDMTLPGQQNPYFASMVTTVDWSLGRLVDYLKKTDDPRQPGKKLIETTYIFFTSDNGGAEKRGKEILSDNAPLKYGKAHAEEGGIRVPMVISGPGIEAGSQFDGLVNQLDYFPTILKLTQSKIAPEDAKELSGLDISPVLKGESQKIVDAAGKERDHLFWHFPHGDEDSMRSAIRRGDFKLYKRHVPNDYELYQIYKDGKRNDYEEVKDLAKNPEYSDVVKRLSETLEAELAANHAEGPYLNPNYAEKTLPVAELGKVSFKANTRMARVNVKPDGPTIQQAYVIYCDAPVEGKKKGAKKKGRRSRQEKVPEDVAIPGMRSPANLLKEGKSANAKIPENIEYYRFMVIDSNNYAQYSEILQAK
ncbi:sulfatase [Verrucomicrobiaceae bacterium 5K15]|uniref:Sulfatase n=1 Tax=Oceaniferula flava TaxID=2800421 RepID=A0AAE2SC70_9BACT|nr:sulfatase [Oceaniferula flavus]MBK1855500.1 sulfatase [Oceaniferula flavus]MBM1136806.1 sulfatase [Oceaniferula flavus]